MNIEARKLEFIQEFLKLKSEDALLRLEKLLRKEQSTSGDHTFTPMTHEELNKRIDKSESDFQNNRFKTSSELLKKYE